MGRESCRSEPWKWRSSHGKLRPCRSLIGGVLVSTAASAHAASVLVGPVHNPATNKYYYLLEPGSWTDAEATAVSLGGHLTTINNQAEQDWVFNTFREIDTGATGCFGLSGNRPDGLWIGLNDVNTEGTFVWADGSAVTFTHWAPGEPFDTGAEDYAVMSNNSPTGLWLDVTDTVGTCRACGVVEVSSVNINGFNPDWLYTATYRPNNNPPPDAADLVAYHATTGELMQTLQAAPYWGSITFAGTGPGQARLFAAKRHPGGGGSNNMRIDEIDAVGGTVKSVVFTNLIGAPPAPLGANVEVGNIRYSSFHGTLFVSINPAINNAGANPVAKVYEVDLALTQVLNTYTGPSMVIHIEAVPLIAINHNDGTLYMCGVGGAERDLIAFDTSGGSTSTYTTLINGTTYQPGDPFWSGAGGVAYRGSNHPGDNRPTIVINNIGTASAQNNRALEFYLDETDVNGNPVKRQDAWIGRRNPYNVQLDDYTGTVMGCRIIGEQGNNNDSGIDQLLPEDIHYRPAYNAAINDRFFSRGQNDTASPGFRISAVEPTAKQTAAAFINGPATPDSVQFTLRNKGYSNNDANVNFDVSLTVSKVPDDASTAWLTLDKTSVGPLAPHERDTVTASINTAGLAAGVHTVELHFTDSAVPANIHTRVFELTILECSWEVSPTPTSTAYVLAAPLSHAYPITIKNLQGAGLSYTVQEVAADGVTPQNHAWLTLDKAGGGPIGAGTSDTVMFTVNSPNTVNTGYLRFTPSCGSATSGAQPQVRTISVVNTLAGGEAVISEYHGDVSPIDPNSCGPGCNFEITADAGNQVMGAVVVDSNAFDQKAWRIQDDNTANTWTHLRTSNNAPNIGTGGTHNGNLGSTLVARIKVPSNMAAGTMLGINLNQASFNGTRVEWGGAGPTLPGLIHETFRGTIGVENGSTSANYTIIRITSGFGITGSRSIRVYVNEDKNPVPIPLEVLSLSNLGNGPSGRGFGYGFGMEGTAQVAGEVWFDWVVFTTAGMFAPGEEVAIIGKSLIPAGCNDPFADSDDDGDVDFDDFAAFQLCYTGPIGSIAPGCECFDRDADAHIDVDDFGDPINPEVNTFVACASGAHVPADPNCDNGP